MEETPKCIKAPADVDGRLICCDCLPLEDVDDTETEGLRPRVANNGACIDWYNSGVMTSLGMTCRLVYCCCCVYG